MTITWELFFAFVAGYGVRELFGFIYREGYQRGFKRSDPAVSATIYGVSAANYGISATNIGTPK